MTANAYTDTLSSVTEAMTDVMLCELVGTEPDFATALLAQLDLPVDYSVKRIRRSVQESSLGETDVELLVEGGAETVAVLVENKIRANLMPDQLKRYRQRGKEGVTKGHWSRFLVVLYSPEKYSTGIPAERAQYIDHYLTYESVHEWMIGENSLRFSLKVHMLEVALSDYRIGYTKQRDTNMTTFHQAVCTIANAEYPELHMDWPTVAGRDDSLIHLPNALPVDGDKLILKFKMGESELRIKSYDPVATERALASVLPDKSWRTTQAKGYAGIAVQGLVLGVQDDFETNEPAVRGYLDSLRALHRFYHAPEVAQLIEKSRGERASTARSRSKVAQ